MFRGSYYWLLTIRAYWEIQISLFFRNKQDFQKKGKRKFVQSQAQSQGKKISTFSFSYFAFSIFPASHILRNTQKIRHSKIQETEG